MIQEKGRVGVGVRELAGGGRKGSQLVVTEVERLQARNSLNAHAEATVCRHDLRPTREEHIDRRHAKTDDQQWAQPQRPGQFPDPEP